MYLEMMKGLLTSFDEARLKSIYAPKMVAVPPADSRRDVMIMPDGEIRCYGVVDDEFRSVPLISGKRMVFLSSKNCGLDWKLCAAPSNTVMGPAIKSPWSNRFVTILPFQRNGDKAGTYALFSEIGPDDPDPHYVKITDDRIYDVFQPTPLISRRRWLASGHLNNRENYTPLVFYSDDDGESWTVKKLKPTPRHQMIWPHKGYRWNNNGAEPNLVELPNGTILLMVRTSLDYFYFYYSHDGGETWTDGEPSPFHGTLTTPFLLRLQDGRILLAWNNTRPLAERNHKKEWPPLHEWDITGECEDAFTNRDVCHLAISDDGTHWTGFRELYLNDIRNAADFRSHGGDISSHDKSVHQFQMWELPFHKVLVSLGQNESSRRLVIFDLDWLYETERHEDFQMGLQNLSTHLYVKSISSAHHDTGFVGHCAWNRTHGALLIPDPAGTYGEALQLCRIHDERLLSELQGAVWNFPKAYKGEISFTLRIAGSGIRVSLCDHWINPCDEYVGEYAGYSFCLDATLLKIDVWHTVTIAYDIASKLGNVFCDGEFLFGMSLKNEMPNGICYIHFQTAAQTEDHLGCYINRIDFTGKD